MTRHVFPRGRSIQRPRRLAVSLSGLECKAFWKISGASKYIFRGAAVKASGVECRESLRRQPAGIAPNRTTRTLERCRGLSTFPSNMVHGMEHRRRRTVKLESIVTRLPAPKTPRSEGPSEFSAAAKGLRNPQSNGTLRGGDGNGPVSRGLSQVWCGLDGAPGAASNLCHATMIHRALFECQTRSKTRLSNPARLARSKRLSKRLFQNGSFENQRTNCCSSHIDLVLDSTNRPFPAPRAISRPKKRPP
ncbi:hypothetical protein M885DRAFT_66459 [Pelagophyceae sp. CCMP2097]|nr:hypothetical protein M885DRAFT_66459 [Pelagophyceae sp. CCMP2097]